MSCKRQQLLHNEGHNEGLNCSRSADSGLVGSGAVKRVGRCDAYATEFDLEAEEYVPLPKVMSHCEILGFLHTCLAMLGWRRTLRVSCG